ncbi:MAG: type II toxin-antitoxin system RelE/ParE family toxin [Xanthobacteraceae bacterium]|nr:type II toxin-antitoxin system RelE/ParE family toxin [Xanthobacteraceae bacterium]
MWGLLITSPAERGLRKAPRAQLEQIDQAFSDMCADPYSGDVKFLRGMGAIFRRRVGDWRILFELDKDRQLIIVLAVKRRSSKTY